jgi:hypothetical protein
MSLLADHHLIIPQLSMIEIVIRAVGPQSEASFCVPVAIQSDKGKTNFVEFVTDIYD